MNTTTTSGITANVYTSGVVAAVREVFENISALCEMILQDRETLARYFLVVERLGLPGVSLEYKKIVAAEDLALAIQEKADQMIGRLSNVNVSGQWRECDRCGLRETKGLGR